MPDLSIGVCLPQYEPSPGLSASDFLSCMRRLVACPIDSIAVGVFDRSGSLYYRSATQPGRMNPEGVDLVAGLGDALSAARPDLHTVVNVRCFDHGGLADDDCVYRYDPAQGRAQPVPGRVCPTSPAYRDLLAVVAREAAELGRFRECHLSYLRYESCFACVCGRCLGQFCASTGRPVGALEPSHLFSDARTFVDWIHWRAGVLAEFVRHIRGHLSPASAKLSIELDISMRRGMLLGLKISEGLDLQGLLDAVDTFVLHVESADDAKQLEAEVRARGVTYQCVRYLVPWLLDRGREAVGFFWSVKTKRDVSDVVSLAEELGLGGVQLHCSLKHLEGFTRSIEHTRR